MIQRIKHIISKTERSTGRFAKKVGISPPTLENYLQGRRKIALSLIEAILTAFPEVSAEWLLRGQGEPFKGGEEARNAVNVGGDVVMSNVASDGAAISTEPKLLTLMERMNELVDLSRINMEARINDLETALADKRQEVATLYRIIEKLSN